MNLKSKIKHWYHWHISNPVYYAKMQIIINRRHMRYSRFWGKRLQELHFGHMFLSKLQFIINFTILLKVFDAAWWLYPIGFIIGSFGMWLLGYVLEKNGVRSDFYKQQMQGVRLDGSGIGSSEVKEVKDG